MPSCQGLGSAAHAAAAMPASTQVEAKAVSAKTGVAPALAAAPRVSDLKNRTISLQPLFGEDALGHKGSGRLALRRSARSRYSDEDFPSGWIRAWRHQANAAPPPHSSAAAAAVTSP